jgi:glycosyltransferase involved in cell wall biosynthesis
MSHTVSIVVPAYNNGDFIEETMRSILSQTYENLEVIVADHSSTDDTWAKLQPFLADRRVRLLQTEPGGGARKNWNRVSAEASGELFKLVCGDDLLAPDIISTQVELFEPGVVLTATSRTIVDANGDQLIGNWGIGSLRGRHSGHRAIRKTVRAGTNLLGEPACVMMRRESLEKVGYWAEGEEYLIDEATYVGVLATGDFVGLNRPLAKFRVNAGQWSVKLAGQQASQAIAFHEKISRTMPGVLSPLDVSIGNAKARVHALARRLVYAYLGARMRRRRTHD